LPLTGDLNDPKTNVSKLVSTTLKTVVVKVVASPFIALGGLLDSIQQNIVQKRIKKIEVALHSYNKSTGINVSVRDSKAPENVGSRPAFELKFAIDE